MNFFEIFLFLGDFFGFSGFLSKFLRLLLKVTKITTGHQKLPKNGPKQHYKPSLGPFFFASAEQSPLQELEVGTHRSRVF